MKSNDKWVHFAEIGDADFWYQYLNGHFIFKKPVGAKYHCSMDVMLIISEKKEKESNMKPKFKVGETVQCVASPDIRVFILETNEQTCYAGVTQVWYTGRVVYSGLHRTIGKMERFSQIELQPVAKASAKLKKLVTEMKDLKKIKEKFIRKQDFEQASAIRDDYKRLELEAEMLSELEGISIKDIDR